MVTEKRKSNSVVVVSYDAEGIMSINVAGVGAITFDKRKASAVCRAEAEDHGWEQRLRDAAAISRDDATGASASPQEKYDAVLALRDHYEGGATEWRLAGGAGGGRSITVEAIARVKGLSYDDASAMVDRHAATMKQDRKDALKFLATSKRVMEAINAIRAERMPAAKVDADKALDEIS